MMTGSPRRTAMTPSSPGARTAPPSPPTAAPSPGAEPPRDPRADLGRDLLAAAEHAAQPEPEPLRLVDRDGDLPEGGGGQQGVGHAPGRHPLPRAGGIEAGRRGHDRDAGSGRAEERAEG